MLAGVKKDMHHSWLTNVVGAAVGWGACFTFFELWKAQRSSLWTSFSLELGASLAGAWFLYAIVMALVVLPFARQLAPASLAIAGCILAATFWFVLTQFGAPIRGTMRGAIGGAILGMGAFEYVMLRFGAKPLRGAMARILGAWAGMVAILLADYLLFLDVERLFYTSLLGGVFFGLVWIVISFHPSRGWIDVGVLVLCFCVAPMAMFYLNLAPHRDESDDRQADAILVTIDTLRADYTSLYGGPVPTPNLEALGARGVTYDWGITLAPWTLPSLTGMFASQYPAGVTPFGRMEDFPDGVVSYRVPDDVPTLAELLRDEGYVTAAAVSNPLLRGATGVDRGFDAYNLIGHRTRVTRGPFQRLPIFGSFWRAWFPGTVTVHPVDTTEYVTRFAERFLARDHGAPFFLWIHYMDPHMPYDPPDRFRSQEGPWRVFSAGDNYWKGPPLDEQKNVVLPEAEMAYVRHLYEGEIRYVDEALGRVMDGAEGRDAVWLLTADHGEELWDHGRFAHGFTLYNEQIRVPTILAGPGIDAARVASPVSAIDLMPTLAAVLGVDIPDGWRGVSLMGDAGARPVFSQATNPWTSAEPYQSVYVDGFKYIRGLETGRREIYLIEDDANESMNRVDDEVDRVEDMDRILDAWQQTFPSTFEMLRKGGASGGDEELQRTLESMGYL